MRIQVDCRDGEDPRAFYLGTRRLRVMHVLERVVEDATRRVRVRVEDGRVFVLIHDTAKGEWRLAGVGAFPHGESGAPVIRAGKPRSARS